MLLPRFLPILLMLALCLDAPAQDAAQYNDLGMQAYQQERFTEAVGYFQQAYKLMPGDETLRHNLVNAQQAAANALAQADRHAEAVPYLEAAVQVDPAAAEPLLQLGSYYLHLGRTADATFRLEEAVELAPENLDGHDLLGTAYYRANHLAAARAHWEYVLENEPNRPGLRERYEKAFREESVEHAFSSGGSRHFQISYPPGVNYSARAQILTILERAYMDIGRQLGRVYPPGPIHVVIYNGEQFTEATQLEGHVGAVYDGKIRVPLTEVEGAAIELDELKRRLVHEYVHVVVRHLLKERAPWWLNEGLAETMTGELDQGQLALLNAAYSQRQVFSLAALEGHQLEVLEPEQLRLAYAQSHAAVDHLWGRYGQQRFLRFLGYMRQGMSAEAALQQTYRFGYSRLEQHLATLYK